MIFLENSIYLFEIKGLTLKLNVFLSMLVFFFKYITN